MDRLQPIPASLADEMVVYCHVGAKHCHYCPLKCKERIAKLQTKQEKPLPRNPSKQPPLRRNATPPSVLRRKPPLRHGRRHPFRKSSLSALSFFWGVSVSVLRPRSGLDPAAHSAHNQARPGGGEGRCAGAGIGVPPGLDGARGRPRSRRLG